MDTTVHPVPWKVRGHTHVALCQLPSHETSQPSERADAFTHTNVNIIVDWWLKAAIGCRNVWITVSVFWLVQRIDWYEWWLLDWGHPFRVHACNNGFLVVMGVTMTMWWLNQTKSPIGWCSCMEVVDSDFSLNPFFVSTYLMEPQTISEWVDWLFLVCLYKQAICLYSTL